MATEWEDWVLKEFLRVAEAAVWSGYGEAPEVLLEEVRGANYDGLKAALKAAEDEWRRRLDVAETEAIRWERSAERVAEECQAKHEELMFEVGLRQQVTAERDELVERINAVRADRELPLWDGSRFYE